MELIRTRSGDTVYRKIREAIRRGDVKPGQALASTRALQDRFGESFHAVRRGLELLESEGLIERRPGSGCYVCEKPSSAVRVCTGTVALFVTAYAKRNPFLAPMMETLRKELDELGLDVIDDLPEIPVGGMPQEVPDADVAVWVFHRVAPVITLPPGRPFVLVGPHFSSVPAKGTAFDVLTVDDRQGAALAGRHLRAAGCRRPFFVGMGNKGRHGWDGTSEMRLRGFEAGWGAPLAEENLVRLEHYVISCAVQEAGRLFAEGFNGDAIFAASDDIAQGINHAAIAHGIAIGRDVKLMGFDGQPPAFPDDPALTTLVTPREAIGRAAARLALERVEDPEGPKRRVAFQCSLKEGDSA